MKTIKTLVTLIALILFGAEVVSAQNLNWKTLNDGDSHLLNASAGLEYGTVFNAGYGYRLPSKLPIVLGIEYSQPSGKKLDDLKVKIGGQVQLLTYGDFGFSARVHGVFRTHKNPLVRLTNFGSDLSGVVGYYREKWFAAGEVGFDKAIVTRFKHSAEYRDNFAQVQDGWYQPATGGNFYYGAIAGVSLGRTDVYLNAGKIMTEDFVGTPLLPFYGKVGITYKL